MRVFQLKHHKQTDEPTNRQKYAAINQEGYQANDLQMCMGSIAGGQGQSYGWMWAVMGGNPHACIFTLACACICKFSCMCTRTRAYVHLHACLYLHLNSRSFLHLQTRELV